MAGSGNAVGVPEPWEQSPTRVRRVMQCQDLRHRARGQGRGTISGPKSASEITGERDTSMVPWFVTGAERWYLAMLQRGMRRHRVGAPWTALSLCRTSSMVRGRENRWQALRFVTASYLVYANEPKKSKVPSLIYVTGTEHRIVREAVISDSHGGQGGDI